MNRPDPTQQNTTMAKPRKTTDEEKEQMLETPAGAAPAEDAAPRLDWPASTETREVTVVLTDEEHINVGFDLIKQINRTASLVASKKASAKEYAIQIDESKEKETEISEAYLTGKARRRVSCTWHFQTNGFDSEGNLIPHSELKTLVRDDTGEKVEVVPITAEDRQLILPLGEEESLEVNMEAIIDAGYSLMETPNESDLDSPFVLTDPDGNETPIDADSKAEAAAAARRLLIPDSAEPEPEESEEE